MFDATNEFANESCIDIRRMIEKVSKEFANNATEKVYFTCIWCWQKKHQTNYHDDADLTGKKTTGTWQNRARRSKNGKLSTKKTDHI